ncbi:MAG: alpha/beta hydrolase [Gammaproteobacteria bacterium]|nr:MAG: alpha/beta hydrolase [Gammaproteobacteria bacterium]RLA24440.1 MAG: alpha/beta hydrolase [Gammaproteobacteria bacterium]
MNKSDGNFSCLSHDGLALHGRFWKAIGEAKLKLVIVHGIGEHSGRYSDLVSYLNRHNIEVLTFDNRGHGQSEGQRGHINSWADYRQDLKKMIELFAEERPDLPLFILGHSFGSLIVLDYILRYPEGFSGAIISASALQPVNVASELQKVAARFLSKLFPRFGLRLNIDPDLLSRIEGVCEDYRNDPLVHNCVTARWGMETLETMNWIKGHTSEMAIPSLFIHGDADGLNAEKGTVEFFNKIRHRDKKLIIYPGRAHEPHQDLGQEEVMKDMVEWLVGRIPSQPELAT